MILSSVVDLRHRALKESAFVDLVLRQFAYDPVSGDLLTRYTRQVAVRTDSTGHGYVTVKGKGRHSSAKIVWVLHHHALPPGPLRHDNDDRTDDRIENLRAKLIDGSVEGCHDRWIVRDPKANRRSDIIGVFKTYEKALAAYERYERYKRRADVLDLV